MDWYLKVLKQYADFNGRARRTEFWMFVLFNFIITMILTFIDSLIGTDFILSGLYGLFILIPGLAVAVRRLHDIGKSGWWIFIQLIPLIGSIWLIVLWAQDSEPVTNEYGPNPKTVVM